MSSPSHPPGYGIDTIYGLFGPEDSPAIIAWKRDHPDYIAIPATFDIPEPPIIPRMSRLRPRGDPRMRPPGEITTPPPAEYAALCRPIVLPDSTNMPTVAEFLAAMAAARSGKFRLHDAAEINNKHTEETVQVRPLRSDSDSIPIPASNIRALTGMAATAPQSVSFKIDIGAQPRSLGNSQWQIFDAVSTEVTPNVTEASATGTDAAAAGGALLLGGLLYLMTRPGDPLSEKKPSSSPPAPVPTVLEAIVPVPPPVDGENPTDVLKPGGQNVGEPGENSGIRVIQGGEREARELFDRLTKGGTDITPPGHLGQVIRMPDGNAISYRPTSKSGPPTIDVTIPGLNIRKLKSPGRSG